MTKKKVFVLVAVIAIVALSVFCLVGCKNVDVNTDKSGGNGQIIDDEQLKPTGGLIYESNGAGFTLVGCDEAIKSYAEIIVADEHEGKPVTAIGEGAFSNFGDLERVIVLGEKLKTIENNAFEKCVVLTDVVLPNSVESIGGSAFLGCASLKNMQDSLEKLPKNDKAPTEVIIPTGVTAIGEAAFSGCSKVASMVIPEGVTAIKDKAFLNCSALRNIQISAKTATIGNESFRGCTNLMNLQSSPIVLPEDDKTTSNVIIPAGVTAIGEKTFLNCSKMKNLKVLGTLKVVPKQAFYGCSALAVVQFGADAAKTNRDSFDIEEQAFSNCYSLKQINFPNNLKSIGKRAFFGTGKLQEIILPQKMTTIGDYAFCGSGLNKITIPSGVTTIGEFAFANNSNMTSVNMALTVKEIGAGAFRLAGKQNVVVDENGIEKPAGGLNIVFNYAGTVQQWKEIKVHGPYFWSDKADIMISCSDDDVKLEFAATKV